MQIENRNRPCKIWAEKSENIPTDISRSLIKLFTGRIWIAKDSTFLWADNEDSYQTAVG